MNLRECIRLFFLASVAMLLLIDALVNLFCNAQASTGLIEIGVSCVLVEVATSLSVSIED